MHLLTLPYQSPPTAPPPRLAFHLPTCICANASYALINSWFLLGLVAALLAAAGDRCGGQQLTGWCVYVSVRVCI